MTIVVIIGRDLAGSHRAPKKTNVAPVVIDAPKRTEPIRIDFHPSAIERSLNSFGTERKSDRTSASARLPSFVTSSFPCKDSCPEYQRGVLNAYL